MGTDLLKIKDFTNKPDQTELQDDEYIKCQHSYTKENCDQETQTLVDAENSTVEIVTCSYLKKCKLYQEIKNEIWWVSLISVSMLSILSRLHYITKPNKVVWDEAHFGKFSSWYLNRTFFFDVHPPGGKLTLALIGYACGYNGSFSFSWPGASYEGYEEILLIRVGCALFGSSVVPISFLIVWELSHSITASTLAAIFILLEIGLITLSKFILLDPILLFCIVLTFHAMCAFNNEQNKKPWTFKWWMLLAYKGVALGYTISVKFVGIFIVLVVGLNTIIDLFTQYKDTTKSLISTSLHLTARILCLMLLPIVVYITIFYIHDLVLKTAFSEGLPGDDRGLSMFSSRFQAKFINNSLHNLVQPQYGTYGSLITLRNMGIGGGYLHSHNFTYPEKFVKGNLQQITTVKIKDHNNDFRLLFPLDDPELPTGYYFGEPEIIFHDDWVRLIHVQTNKTVAAHRNSSVVTGKNYIVYGKFENSTEKFRQNRQTKNDDLWKISIVDRKSDNVPLEPLHTKFQIKSPKFKCALAWSKEKLPDWAFRQGEMVCTRNFMNPYTLWTLETVVNPYARNVSYKNIESTFFDRFIESHRMMTYVNARLKPDGNLQNLDKPWMWPILYKSAPWYDAQFRIVLLGNPFLFLINLFSILITPIVFLHYIYKQTRFGSNSWLHKAQNENSSHFHRSLFWLYVAYIFHYLPFFTMDRILYFHHYFPSHTFACMISALHLTKGFEKVALLFKRNRTTKNFLVVITVIMTTVSFSMYCYVGYGHETISSFNPENSTFKKIRFNENWLI